MGTRIDPLSSSQWAAIVPRKPAVYSYSTFEKINTPMKKKSSYFLLPLLLENLQSFQTEPVIFCVWATVSRAVAPDSPLKIASAPTEPPPACSACLLLPCIGLQPQRPSR